MPTEIKIDIPATATPTVIAAVQWLADIASLLLQKNAAYGDSAANPIRIFSKSDPVEQIKVRIDDKLSRIAKGNNLLEKDEDVIKDLVGYFALLMGVKNVVK